MTSDINIDAYKKILLPKGDVREIGFIEDNFLSSVTEQFKKATQGQDVINNDFVAALMGAQTNASLSRSEPFNKNDFSLDVIAIAILIHKRVADGLLHEDEEKNLKSRTDALVIKTRIDANLLKDYISSFEKQMKAREEELSERGYILETAEDRKISREMNLLLKKSARGHMLSAEEEQKIKSSLEYIGNKLNIKSEERSEDVQSYIKLVHERDKAMVDVFTIDLNDKIKTINSTTGLMINRANKNHMVVPDYGAADAQKNLIALGFSANDLPKKASPFKNDELECIVAIHEAKHANQYDGNRLKLKTPDGMSPRVQEMASDIDADLAIVNFLEKAGRHDLKDYWLQKRQLMSFLTFNPFHETSLGHDVAAFIEIYKKTGQQLDLEKFHKEKWDLLKQVHKNLSEQDQHNVIVNEISPSVYNLVVATRKTLEQNSNLSNIQKEQARAFLEAAKNFYEIDLDKKSEILKPKTKSATMQV